MAKSEKKSILGKTISGQLVSGAFFARYWIQVVLFMALMLVQITNRYSTQREMEQIRQLTERLRVVQTESMRVRGEYMSRIRESSMRQRLDTLGIDLAVQQKPPYHIKK